MCIRAIKPKRDRFPHWYREGVAFAPVHEVDRVGEAMLVCDEVHDGPHEWPEAMATIEVNPGVTKLAEDSDA